MNNSNSTLIGLYEMIKKLNSFTILFIITMVMVVLMLITIQRPDDISDDYFFLFADLSEQLNNVDTLQFKSDQDEFTLYKEGEDWFVKERLNYLADFNLVKRALIDISDAKILERKTNDPEHYVVLGVNTFDQGGSAVQITMLNGEQQVAGLILGSERETTQNAGTKQFYVRRVGEDRVWLAEGYLNINPLMLNWLKSEVIDIARERIAEVNIIQPNGQTATIINLGKKDKFGTPQDREETVFKYERLGYDIASSLYQLRMEDVQVASEFSRGDAEVVTAEFNSYDGLKIVTKTSFNDGSYYTSFQAEFVEGPYPEVPADIAQLDTLKTPEQVLEEVAVINKQLAPWIYQFSGFVGTNLMRAEADIVTKIEQTIPMPADLSGFGP